MSSRSKYSTRRPLVVIHQQCTTSVTFIFQEEAQAKATNMPSLGFAELLTRDTGKLPKSCKVFSKLLNECGGPCDRLGDNGSCSIHFGVSTYPLDPGGWTQRKAGVVFQLALFGFETNYLRKLKNTVRTHGREDIFLPYVWWCYS